MSEKILVPVLGESITEATVAKWLKKEGDTVVADEAIVELETDKVNLEVPSPIDGVLSEINSKDGETVEGCVLRNFCARGSACALEYGGRGSSASSTPMVYEVACSGCYFPGMMEPKR